MRHPVEESEEVKARRALRTAALKYAADYLVSFGADDAELVQASQLYAQAVEAGRVKSVRKTKR